MRTPEEIVRAEVLVCVSSLVSTLAGVSGMSQSAIDADLPAWELFNAAVELAAPVPDYESAARDHGWHEATDDDGTACVATQDNSATAADWEEACLNDRLDPYDRKVYEHWAVTGWLADHLEAHGEKVDKDFAGMCVWARTTTEQAIYADSVIEKIAADLNARIG